MPAEFHFLRPLWFLALLPAALLLLKLARHRQSRANWTEVCDAELLPFVLQDQPAAAQRRYSLVGAALAAVLAIAALAGPTWERLPSPAFRNDAALVIALDLSKSMDAADIKPSRIGKARYKIADLLKQRKDGQTALLVYGGDAFTVTPLTTDTATIDSQLPALTTDIMPSPGSHTSIAIEHAVNLLRQAGLAKGHILLVTDGADADVAEQAEQWLGGYQLSVLAVGTADGAPIQAAGGGFLKDRSGNIVVAKMDEVTLATLARNGRGLYQPVTAGDEDIEALSRVFNSAVTDPQNQDSNLLLQQWDEKGPWLVLLVLPWAAVQFRKGLLLWCLLSLAPLPRNGYALDWQSLWKTPDQRAKQAFEQQQYQQAAEQFQDQAWRAAAQYKAGQYEQAAETLKDANSAEGHYNRGNALALAGRLPEAVQAYQQALQLDPQHQDAKYNKELVEKKLQEQQQQPNQGPDRQPQDGGQEPQSQDRQSQSGQADRDRQSEAAKPPEQPGEQSAADERKQAGQQPKQPEQNPSDSRQTTQPDQAQDQPKDAQPETQPAQSAAEVERNETERANEQLLKRIPDEPTGLLRRKFKYQYSQRNRRTQAENPW
ncbi:VWA domain-containing protein [Methylomonas sp. SURF-1]|uniref:VWA domain-containing protein n=1 Tax=Methylomonas aurea TaxID=2952224 RepID=A0ABT1UID9_9GAMM|nr:VWA domain-containing protein [Methylomonas sp. SURF-1]MCQ8182009.1 VWA domain-containing protein [Methylomonas sp. SURF-1]